MSVHNTDVALAARGRAWVMADDNINTDLIMPSEAFRKPVDEQATLVFRDYRPGWTDAVTAGDILVVGRNFGTGSSRPAAHLLRILGVSAIVAESFNGLFYRNCVNYGLPALECPGVTSIVVEGDEIAVDVANGSLRNVRSAETLHGEPMPELLATIVASGGLLERLRNEGYV